MAIRCAFHLHMWPFYVFLFIDHARALAIFKEGIAVAKEGIAVAKEDTPAEKIALDSNPLSPSTSTKPPVGTIVGGTVGGVVAVLIIGAVALYFILRRSRRRKLELSGKTTQQAPKGSHVPLKRPQGAHVHSNGHLRTISAGMNGVPAQQNPIPLSVMSPTLTSPYSPGPLSSGVRTSSPAGSTHSLTNTQLPSSRGHASPIGVPATIHPADIITPFLDGILTPPSHSTQKHDNAKLGPSPSSRSRMNPPAYSDLPPSDTSPVSTSHTSPLPRSRFSLRRTGKGSISKRSINTARSIETVISDGSGSHNRGPSGGSTNSGMGGGGQHVRSTVERRHDRRHQPAV